MNHLFNVAMKLLVLDWSETTGVLGKLLQTSVKKLTKSELS
jgi:hypothetical protein